LRVVDGACPIYTAPTAEAAEAALNAFEPGESDRKFPTAAARRRTCDRVTPFLEVVPENWTGR